jgi:tetratricopeptide (TPR) repeat protein
MLQTRRNPFAIHAQETAVKAITEKIFSTALILSLIFSGPAGAFAQDIDEEIQKPSTAADTQKSAIDLAEEADQRRAIEDADGVTYADVLKDPDNIELNYKFAKSQVADGNLKGAATTLERILMIDPALPKVRLFYAIVLYRLGNLHEALRELEGLRKVPMTESLKAEIDLYIARIKRELRRTNWNATAGFGMQWDNNRNSAPSSGTTTATPRPPCANSATSPSKSRRPTSAASSCLAWASNTT